METRADVISRVEAHRAAFAPSELTFKKYDRARRSWAYRPELDRVVCAPDGEVAAFCTAWLDEQNRAGLLDPAIMAKKQVESILGQPTSTDTKDLLTAKTTTYVYRQGKESVTIVFKDDKVQAKQSTLSE